MRTRSFALLAPLLAFSALAPACSQTATLVPLRSMERPKDVDFVCLEGKADGTFAGVSLDKCAIDQNDFTAVGKGKYRLHAVVTQVLRGELAVVDIGATPGDSISLLKVDPRIPGYSFIPTVAAPVDVVADPMGTAVFVASGRDPRIDVIPAAMLRGPIDTEVASQDPPPWPHLDFDRATDGTPGSMTVVREGDVRRLYVTLPEAKDGPKIAVFGLGEGVLPAFVGFIKLGAAEAPALPWKPIACGSKGTTETWWAAYDVCGGEAPKIPKGQTAAPVTTDSHFAGTAVAAGKLFVADDRAGYVHVFAVKGGAGVEEVRIPIGSPTSRLAVSPVVPDEVTLENARAIDLCVARGWIGDGLDHSTDSAEIRDQLKGRCRAHRYLYAIDLVNSDAGGGSVAIVDLPVILSKTATATDETLDLAGAELVQPMACDAPSFPGRRLPLGPFALNASNVVPARAITFVQYDPPARNLPFAPAARCRPWDRSTSELAGVPDAERTARLAAGEYWRSGVDPTRMRGTYAWVALANGAVVTVDLDDYDSLCRGPNADKAKSLDEVRTTYFTRDDEPTFTGFSAENGARTGEYYPRAVQRHHVRSLRQFNKETQIPGVSAVSLTRFGAVLSNDPKSETGRKYPHFAGLTEAKAPDAPALVLPAPDNPFTILTETWTATYEGIVPGYSGSFGNLQAGTQLTLTDPTGAFCSRGVETRGAVATHDVVQLIDPVCDAPGSCEPKLKEDCLAEFGAADAQPLKKERSLLIEKSFEGKLVLANKVFKPAGGELYQLADGAPNVTRIKQCFGSGLLRYTVRANGAAADGAPWLVYGSSSGYSHRWIVDPTSGDEKACALDLSKPRILDSRAPEAPALSAEALANSDPLSQKIVGDRCERFTNVAWKFAIRRGTANSLQDMKFTFAGRFSWQPLSIGAGSLAASLRPVSAWWDGKEHLGWNMLAVVDSIDRGLYMFPASSPFSFQKSVN